MNPVSVPLGLKLTMLCKAQNGDMSHVALTLADFPYN
jgi:hypothetical protein